MICTKNAKELTGGCGEERRLAPGEYKAEGETII